MGRVALLHACILSAALLSACKPAFVESAPEAPGRSPQGEAPPPETVTCPDGTVKAIEKYECESGSEIGVLLQIGCGEAAAKVTGIQKTGSDLVASTGEEYAPYRTAVFHGIHEANDDSTGDRYFWTQDFEMTLRPRQKAGGVTPGELYVSVGSQQIAETLSCREARN